MVLSYDETNMLSHVQDNNLVQMCFSLDEKRSNQFIIQFKINSAKFTINHSIAKVNSVKFTLFGPAYRKFFLRKFLPLKIYTIKVTLMGELQSISVTVLCPTYPLLVQYFSIFCVGCLGLLLWLNCKALGSFFETGLKGFQIL